ncbi:hypothetical protein [Stenotrophomonas sp. GD03958]|uniref:hypothetical protein n=1 Tax=Stenotrophomonas sp. GD03958 TaxID=2975411 RepID=UPI0021C89CCA|nr:hypothetical protein [Stenotrophomonas sp. GD03958]MCU1088795.1 hypothetical protein [Stenotrophomonas maltophilia]MDH1193899.1 hypothetical protein [Stenotrophomonas sp. GD03958]
MMIDTLSRGIDVIAGRLRQIAAGYDRTILFTAGSLDAGCDSGFPAFPQLGKCPCRSVQRQCAGAIGSMIIAVAVG